MSINLPLSQGTATADSSVPYYDTLNNVYRQTTLEALATVLDGLLTTGGGASAFTDLTDKTTADIPGTNAPLAAALALKATLASPALTGTPTAPTATLGTNTTQVATTAFVLANAGGGGGAAAFTDLSDKTSADLPTINTPLASALALKQEASSAYTVLGPYADATALESAKPAASNGGRVALVGASAPYNAYVSNGTAWLLFDNNSDPLVTVASSGSSVSQAATNLSVLNITLTANTTLGFTGIPTGTWSITLILRQDGTTGSRLVTWPANTKWAAATAPTLSTAASAVDVVTLMTIDAGTTWFGFLGGKGMA